MIASATASLRWSRWTKHRTPHAVTTSESSEPGREHLLVIGSGMVSQRFCERLVSGTGTRRYRITVVGEEELPAYDRVHLTDIWRGKNPRDLVIRGGDWYCAHGIDLRLGERATDVDREARRVTTSRGMLLEYDKLVFATGSRATLPSILVDPNVTLLTYRTIEDAQRILVRARQLAGTDRAVVIVGGGLLGLEAARSIQQLGCRTIILEASSQLLPRQLDPDAASDLLDIVVRAGIEVRLKARIERITACPIGVRVVLGADDAIEAGTVVAAVGARAADELARASGLICSARGGIEVDTWLGTNDPRVFAIGECAVHAHVPHGLVAPGYAMADVLASNLLGKRRRLTVQQAVTRLKLDLTEVNVLGNPLASDGGRDLVWRGSAGYRRLVVHGSRVVAALAVGAWPELSALQQHISERRRIARARLETFVESGELGLLYTTPDVATLPDRAVVCQCANVTCGTLRRAIADGHQSPHALARVTSASTLCGSCRPLLAALSGAPDSTPPPAFGSALVATAIASFALALLTLVLPRVPIATSIRDRGFDVVFIDPVYKQISGFSILGLLLLGLTLSARKRIQRFRIGSYSAWRVLHGALGVAGLGALFAHTGLRLGQNLNLGLTLAFLLSATTGAAAGVVTQMNSSGSTQPGARRWASTLRSAHDYAFWPVGVLLVFHVIKVYYY